MGATGSNRLDSLRLNQLVSPATAQPGDLRRTDYRHSLSCLSSNSIARCAISEVRAMPLQRLIISESGRDTTAVAGSACVAVAAIGALLLHMGLPTLAAIVGLPAWAGVIALLGWRLHACISFPMVLGLASIGDLLLVAAATIGTGPLRPHLTRRDA